MYFTKNNWCSGIEGVNLHISEAWGTCPAYVVGEEKKKMKSQQFSKYPKHHSLTGLDLESLSRQARLGLSTEHRACGWAGLTEAWS